MLFGIRATMPPGRGQCLAVCSQTPRLSTHCGGCSAVESPFVTWRSGDEDLCGKVRCIGAAAVGRRCSERSLWRYLL
eukprot:3745049-Alexandrium_andersonii.AAC.1